MLLQNIFAKFISINVFSREVHVTVKDVNEYIPEWGQVIFLSLMIYYDDHDHDHDGDDDEGDNIHCSPTGGVRWPG